MIKALIFVLCFFAADKAMADEWSTQDMWLAASSTALIAADWAQTRYIVKHPEFTEQWSPILPEHPTINQVNANFAIGMALNLLIGDAVGSEWRSAWFGGVSVVEGVTVAHNLHLGIQVKF